VGFYVTGISTLELHPEFPPRLGTLTKPGRFKHLRRGSLLIAQPQRKGPGDVSHSL
jgi:hypothetical protein